MRRIVDISGQWSNGMWSYNELPDLGVRLAETNITPVANIRDHGWQVNTLTISTHSGTYLETPALYFEDGETIDQLEVSDLVKPAKIARVPQKGPGERITADEMIQGTPPIQEGDALIVDCGWWHMWNKPGYVTESPTFTPAAGEWILKQPISLIGVDLSVAEGPDCVGQILPPLMRRGALLLAGLMHLDQIRNQSGELIVLPLNLKGISGAPCRAVVIEGD